MYACICIKDVQYNVGILRQYTLMGFFKVLLLLQMLLKPYQLTQIQCLMSNIIEAGL